MPKPEPSRIDTLERLLAERRKHEGYLTKLEERRATTPEHVFARLRDEYLTKLTDLQVRAAAEAEVLAESVGAEQAEVAEIEARLNAVQEERIEGELRADVGEYEPKEWAKRLTVLNATIAQLEKERDAKSSAYEHTQSLIDEARAGIGGLAPAPAASPAPAVAAATEPRTAPSAPPPEPRTGASAAPRASEPRTGASAAPVPEAPRRGTEMAGAPSFDELAFLNSVVGRTSTPVQIPPAPPVPRVSKQVPVEAGEPSTGASAPPPRAPTPVRPPEPVPAAAAPEPPTASAPSAPPAAVPPAVAPSPAPAPPPASVPADAPSASAPEPASGVSANPSRGTKAATPAPTAADDEPPGPLGRPTPRTSQAVKTLKCQECGTFNYPTEWYCERCGGELAAL